MEWIGIMEIDQGEVEAWALLIPIALYSIIINEAIIIQLRDNQNHFSLQAFIII